jgi:hypothetical protein
MGAVRGNGNWPVFRPRHVRNAGSNLLLKVVGVLQGQAGLGEKSRLPRELAMTASFGPPAS